jgi:hypothetical protein
LGQRAAQEAFAVVEALPAASVAGPVVGPAEGHPPVMDAAALALVVAALMALPVVNFFYRAAPIS